MGVADLLRLVRAGFTTVMWSFDAVDSLREEGRWTGATPDYADVVAGDIILMHDDNATCARELPALLAALKAKGLQPVTVSELMAFRR
jgi:peptidoglycan/xylan/chitin deacetylase (PgdA/CDA1 family)